MYSGHLPLITTRLYQGMNVCIAKSVRSTFYHHTIILSIYSLWHLVQKRPPRRWPQQKSLHLSLSIHSLLACLNPPFYQHLFLLLYHVLPSYSWPYSPPRIPNFTYMCFTLLSLHMTKPLQSISFHPFHYTILHSICTRSYATSFLYAFIALPPILSYYMLFSDN